MSIYISCLIDYCIPDSATWSIPTCCSCAIKPRTEKIVKPAIKLVPELTMANIMLSLKVKRFSMTLSLLTMFSFTTKCVFHNSNS